MSIFSEYNQCATYYDRLLRFDKQAGGVSEIQGDAADKKPATTQIILIENSFLLSNFRSMVLSYICTKIGAHLLSEGCLLFSSDNKIQERCSLLTSGALCNFLYTTRDILFHFLAI